MDITICLPDVFDGNRDAELKIIAFLVRRNFPFVKKLSFRIVPRVNEFGFANFAQVNCLYLTKVEKTVRIYDATTYYLRKLLLCYAKPAYIFLTNSTIFLRRTLGLRCHQDRYYVVGNHNLGYQIAGFIQSILLLRMPETIRSIIEHGDDGKLQYSVVTELC